MLWKGRAPRARRLVLLTSLLLCAVLPQPAAAASYPGYPPDPAAADSYQNPSSSAGALPAHLPTPGSLRVGVGRADITPPTGYFLMGWERGDSKGLGVHTRLYPEVEAGLSAMRDAGLKLACVTNKPHRFAVELLEQYGLSQYFSVVLGGDSLPKKKPDPLPMITAAAQLGVTPETTVAIGDSA